MSHSTVRRFAGAITVLGALACGPAAVAEKAYWSVNDVALQRANLDGTNVEDVVPGFTRGIAIDTVARKIYWGQFDEVFALRRANLDGSAVEILVDFGPLVYFIPLALDREGGKIYMGMGFFEGCGGIRRSRWLEPGSDSRCRYPLADRRRPRRRRRRRPGSVLAGSRCDRDCDSGVDRGRTA